VHGQHAQSRLDAHVVGSSLVMREGQTQKFIAQQVPATAVERRETGAAKGGQRTMRGRLWTAHRTRKLVKARAVGMAGKLGEHGENAVGAD
jgi:hypothetical protein